jgi:sigma-E factor negative regulatory protein RseC
MKNPHGHIIALRSDNSAVVEIDSTVACERCASGKGCGAGLLGTQPGDRHVEAIVAKNLNLRNGDEVSIALQPSNVLRAAVIVYGYPLLGALVAAGFAYTAVLGDVAAALAALAGLVGGFLVARWRLKSARCLREFTPVVIERLAARAV